MQIDEAAKKQRQLQKRDGLVNFVEVGAVPLLVALLDVPFEWATCEEEFN